MPTMTERKGADGVRRLLAQARVKGFKPVAKTFFEKDYADWRAAREAARKWATELEQQLRERRADADACPELGTLTFADLTRQYLAESNTRDLSTYEELEMKLAWWVQERGTARAAEFANPLRLRELRNKLEAKFKPATVNRYLAAARACVRYGAAAGLLTGAATLWPPKLMLKENNKRKRYLSYAELMQALKAAAADSAVMHAAVLFAVSVGCRQSEQLRVRWCDIDAARNTVAISVTKTDTSRRAYLPAETLAALKRLKAERKVISMEGFVFADEEGRAIPAHVLIDRWQKIRLAAKVPDVRWHDLRHTCASYLIQQGATLPQVGDQLGHLNLMTTMRYAHLVPGTKPTGADAVNAELARLVRESSVSS